MDQIDIIPTLYGLLGIPADSAAQGENVLAKEGGESKFIFSLAQSPAAHQYSVVYGEWQLLADQDNKSIQTRYVGKSDLANKNNISQETRIKMAQKLDTWVSAQLGYYSSPKIHTRYYPPSYNNIVNINQSSNRENNCVDRSCTAYVDN